MRRKKRKRERKSHCYCREHFELPQEGGATPAARPSGPHPRNRLSRERGIREERGEGRVRTRKTWISQRNNQIEQRNQQRELKTKRPIHTRRDDAVLNSRSREHDVTTVSAPTLRGQDPDSHVARVSHEDIAGGVSCDSCGRGEASSGSNAISEARRAGRRASNSCHLT